MNIPISARAGVQFGAAYSPKGGQWDGVVEGVSYATDISIGYIELMGLARLEVVEDSRFGAHLLGGSSVALLLSCEGTVSVGGSGTTISETESCKDGTKSVDLGIVGGAGIEIGLTGEMSVNVDVLYNYGLVDIDSDSDDDGTRNRVLALRAGMAFPIG